MSGRRSSTTAAGFMSLPTERRGVAFIELASLEASVREIGVVINYVVLRDFLLSCGIEQMHVFVSLNEEGAPKQFTQLYSLSEWMSFNGYLVRRRHSSVLPGGGIRRANMDVDLTVALMEAAFLNLNPAERIILFCGDRDLVPAVEAVRRRGVVVEVCGVTRRVVAPHVSRLMRQAADNFVELRPMLESINGIKEKKLLKSDLDREQWTEEPSTGELPGNTDLTKGAGDPPDLIE